jgi:hypothetical protein
MDRAPPASLQVRPASPANPTLSIPRDGKSTHPNLSTAHYFGGSSTLARSSAQYRYKVRKKEWCGGAPDPTGE